MKLGVYAKVGWEAAKANRLPMLALWFFAVVSVVGYYTVPCVAAAFKPLIEFQLRHGWLAAFANRLVFTGLLPGLFLCSMKSIRPRHPLAVVVVQSLWCGIWGVVCDKMYVFVDWIFGGGTDVLSVALKTLFDQLPWTVLVIAPSNAAFYFWVGRDFSLRRTREDWPSGAFWRTLVLPFLFANWCVWVPVTIAVFLFPLPLRVHVVGFASAFWTLMCICLGRAGLTLSKASSSEANTEVNDALDLRSRNIV